MYLYEKIERDRRTEKMREQINAPYVKAPIGNTKYVSLMGSMSHTYGNVLAFMQKYILDLFPENMFKTVHVNSKIAHRQLKSTEHEYIKKMKPMIIFRPRISGMDEDRFLKGTELTERQTDIYREWGTGSLQNFFDDTEKDLCIKYQLNRSVMYIDVVVLLSTLMQQIDYYHYIENAIRINHPFMIPATLESYMPQEMMAVLSECSGVPLYDDHGNTKEFIDYMNGHSLYPITYKLQGSTKSREFYRYYPVNIDTIITDLDKDDGDRVGMVMDQYRINFTVRCEFNSTGFYYIFNDKIFDLKLPKVEPTDSDYIPIYTDVLLREDLQLAQGWNMYNRGSFRLEGPDDTVNFDQMLNMSIRACIDYHRKNGLPYFEFLDIKLRRQGTIIHEGIDYFIDWDKLEISFKNADEYHTYSIWVCVNTEYINNLVKDVYKLD